MSVNLLSSANDIIMRVDISLCCSYDYI